MGRGRARGRGRRGRRPPGSDPQRWKRTALIAAAVITILSPVVKLVVEVGESALDAPRAQLERECGRQPPAQGPPF